MSTTAGLQSGARLVLPLRRLEQAPQLPTVPAQPAPEQAPTPSAGPVVSRLLHLDHRPAVDLARWVAQFRISDEACLVLDSAGRVVAMSGECGVLMELQPEGCVGALLLDLVYLVDFTQTGLPLLDAERSTPPLRALRSQRLARGLVRLRLPLAGPATFDVVGVPLASGAGALGFFSRV